MQAEAALKLFSRLKSKERRIHLSKSNSFAFMGVVQPTLSRAEMRMFRKPHGLWYGINDSWIDWCASEEMGWVHNYIHEVILDESKILKITNIRQFDAFEKEYGRLDPLLDQWPRRLSWGGMDYIDFYKVAEKYSGLEITPYIYEKRLISMWYYGWDCASGCVWDATAIRDVRLFASFNSDKDAFVRTTLQYNKLVVK